MRVRNIVKDGISWVHGEKIIRGQEAGVLVAESLLLALWRKGTGGGTVVPVVGATAVREIGYLRRLIVIIHFFVRIGGFFIRGVLRPIAVRFAWRRWRWRLRGQGVVTFTANQDVTDMNTVRLGILEERRVHCG